MNPYGNAPLVPVFQGNADEWTVGCGKRQADGQDALPRGTRQQCFFLASLLSLSFPSCFLFNQLLAEAVRLL